MNNIITVYESDFYIVRALPGSNKSPYILTSFTGISAPERHDGTFFGYSLSKKLNIPFVGIVAKNDCWYLDGDYAKTFHIAHEWQKKLKHSLTSQTLHIGYGISMGAYAVVKHSTYFDFDYIVSLSPQWSINKTEVDHTDFIHSFYSDFMGNMGVKRDDLPGKTYIFYDPQSRIDTIEANYFLKHTTAQTIPVCYAGHMVTNSIKGSDTFLKILENIDNKLQIRKIVSKARRKSPVNVLLIIEQTLLKNKKLTIKALLSNRSIKSGAKDTFLSNQNRLWELAIQFAEENLIDAAYIFFFCATKKRKQIIKLPKILSWKGEILCFCHKENIFTQTDKHIQSTGNMVTIIDNQLFSITPSGLVPINCHIECINNRISILFNGNYISAREDHSTSFVDYVARWEEFILMPYPKDFDQLETQL